MTRNCWLTDEVRCFRASDFWRIVPNDDDITEGLRVSVFGADFSTLYGAELEYVEAGAFMRWRWLCPNCGRSCDMLYRVNITRPTCRKCAGLGYPSQYEKCGNGHTLLSSFRAALRDERRTEQRQMAKRARWRRYYARHRMRILARRRELQAMRKPAQQPDKT